MNNQYKGQQLCPVSSIFAAWRYSTVIRSIVGPVICGFLTNLVQNLINTISLANERDSEIFNDTKRRAISLRQLNFLFFLYYR